jgi:hypothetical protein
MDFGKLFGTVQSSGGREYQENFGSSVQVRSSVGCSEAARYCQSERFWREGELEQDDSNNLLCVPIRKAIAIYPKYMYATLSSRVRHRTWIFFSAATTSFLPLVRRSGILPRSCLRKRCRVFSQEVRRVKKFRHQLDFFRVFVSHRQEYKRFPNIPPLDNPFVLLFTGAFCMKRKSEKKVVQFSFGETVQLEAALTVGDV